MLLIPYVFQGIVCRCFWNQTFSFVFEPAGHTSIGMLMSRQLFPRLALTTRDVVVRRLRRWCRNTSGIWSVRMATSMVMHIAGPIFWEVIFCGATIGTHYVELCCSSLNKLSKNHQKEMPCVGCCRWGQLYNNKLSCFVLCRSGHLYNDKMVICCLL